MKFPTRLLFVLLGLVVALGVAEITIRALEPLPAASTWPTAETQLKSRQMAAIEAPIEVLFVGSSITEAAVDPSLVVDAGVGSAYNAAVPFSYPVSMDVWVREVAAPATEPSVVVIGMTPWAPTDPEIQDLVIEGLERAAEESKSEGSLLSFSALWRNRGVMADFDYLLDQLFLAESGLWTELGHQTGYRDLPQDFTSGPPRIVGARRMSGSNESALRQLVDHLQEEGVTVVFMIEPTRDPEVREARSTAVYLESLEELASSLGVELWDMYSVAWPDSLFTDNDHFNAEGTRQFSLLVAERLAGLIRGE
jgi:hypothetical protein